MTVGIGGLPSASGMSELDDRFDRVPLNDLAAIFKLVAAESWPQCLKFQDQKQIQTPLQKMKAEKQSAE